MRISLTRSLNNPLLALLRTTNRKRLRTLRTMPYADMPNDAMYRNVLILPPKYSKLTEFQQISPIHEPICTPGKIFQKWGMCFRRKTPVGSPDPQDTFLGFGVGVYIVNLFLFFCTLIFSFKMDRHYHRPLDLVGTGWDWLGLAGMVGRECAESRVGPQGPLVNGSYLLLLICTLRRFSLG